MVGADGVQSNVRRLVFGDDTRFRRDLGLSVSVFSLPNFLDLDRTGLLYGVPGKTASIYSARGNREAIAMLFFTASPGAGDRYGGVKPGREIVADVFGGEAWYVPRLLQEMWQAMDFYFDTASQVHMDRWSDGRVVLIGDAGYAGGPGGNGTGGAVVAAYILAGELAAAGGDYGTAFARYERLLRHYVAASQKQAASAANFLAPATWKKIHQRNRFFKLLPYLPIQGLIRKLENRTASAIKLPEYLVPPALNAADSTAAIEPL
ncbi:MAG: hypothetical protein JF888_13465 [Candidatus Dormibacteraeota bacterium]|uniref:FAD-binding domain-containing protein n=1 Tax=Candidatus Dormiibacter inghamiae TaxID=3127013 RepID=A0A934K9C0_9BACT|nr:hypothetical protein [Candidatus Dormibacteraeota bacterium]MBJ7606401.1 hypothetical protein [Candidatus Dormibacteraeota bacterium]